MIVRVVLALDRRDSAELLRNILTRSDVLVSEVENRHLLWEKIAGESGDLIIVIRSLVPVAAANPTALDTVLARLLLAERPADAAIVDRLAELAPMQ